MNTSRDQLSLFLSGPGANAVNACRAVLDPVQAHLIPAHVTVCREDELGELLSLGAEDLRARLQGCASLTLSFGPPERFGGHGVLLPCTGGQTQLDDLRRRLLRRDEVRAQPAHITLAHPRNPRAPGNADELPAPVQAAPWTLSDLRWIRQVDGGVWATVARFSLGPALR